MKVSDGTSYIESLINSLRAHGIIIGRKSEQLLKSDFLKALKIPEIKDFTEWNSLPVSNTLSNLGESASRGQIQAIRFDKLSNVPNLKKHIVSSLLLRGLLTGELNKKTEYILDGGNVNTGLALRYYADKLGLKCEYIVTRYFLDEMVETLKTPTFDVIRAPENSSLAIEEEFYSYVKSEFLRKRRTHQIFATWHAKRCFFPSNFIAQNINQSINSKVDCIVVAVGSGATLAITHHLKKLLLEKYGTSPKIIIAEHEKTPIYGKMHKLKPSTDLGDTFDPNEEDSGSGLWGFRNHLSDRIPHLVLGPHYEKENELVPEHVTNDIDYVQFYSEQQLRNFAHIIEKQNLNVGNTSIANLLISHHLSKKNLNVVTFILEPFREFTRIAPTKEF